MKQQLHQPPLSQADHGTTRDNEVVQHPHVHQRQRRLGRLRQRLVRPGRLRVTAWMVVTEQDGSRPAGQGLDHHLTGINRGLRQGATKHLQRLNDPPIRPATATKEVILKMAIRIGEAAKFGLLGIRRE